MKVLLYTEFYNALKTSGLGKAIEHQCIALKNNNVAYTLNLKDDYDIIHINHYGPKSYKMSLKSHKNGKKVVYHAHSTEEDFRNSFILTNTISKWFKKRIIKCYTTGDVIVTPTEYSKKLLKKYGIKNRIEVVSNGIDLSFFQKNDNNSFREKYKFSKNDKLIICVGTYMKRKGILDFVELAKKMPNYNFLWFGESPLILAPKKIKKAVKTKLKNLFFMGYVEPEVLRDAYSTADLFLYTTNEETEGIPILEALACKTKTLVRDIPVFSDFEDKKDVYKFKTNAEAIDLIEKILNNKIKDLTEIGYDKVKDKDINIVGKKLKKIYNELLSSKE